MADERREVAARRGMGSPRQCARYPVEGMGLLPDDPVTREGCPETAEGPAHPRRAANFSDWFVMGEIALSAFRGCHVLEASYGGRVTLELGDGGLKTAAGGGVRRSVACICASPANLACPCCDVLRQIQPIEDKSGPLFPASLGENDQMPGSLRRT